MNRSDGPWEAYEPTPQDPWDLRKVAHLHRRAGFGATWTQLQRDLAAGPAESVERLLCPPPENQSFQLASSALRRTAELVEHNYTTDPQPAGIWWLYRMAYSGDPLGEKLTLLWHNHFATALHGVYNRMLMLMQNDLFREQARGQFGELLRAVESDRAMLVWLDGGRSQRDHPNENFARELLELFTLGEGNYSEEDVRAAARALTGWRPGRDNLLNPTSQFVYDNKLADTGTKTFLGETGPWRREDILRIILAQPATARHVCRRLYRWFVSEASPPTDELIEPLAAEFRATNYSIEHVVGIMLRSRHFFSPAAYRQRVKSPVEFCIGTLRQLEPARTPNLLMLAATSCERQGQVLFDPPSVKGWDGGAAWLNSGTTLARLNWVEELVAGNATARLPAYDPLKWARENEVQSERLIEVYCSLLVQDDVGAVTRELARRLAGEAGAAPLRAALQILMQSPEYQLA